MGRPSLRRRFSQTIDLIGDKTAAATVGVQLPHAVLDRAAKVFYGGRSREWGKPQKRILLRPVAVFAVVFEVFGTMIVFLVIIGLAALGLWCLAIFAAPVPAVVRHRPVRGASLRAHGAP